MKSLPRTRRWFDRLVVLSAFAYPAALGALALGFFFVGERWWLTAAGLYVPRSPYAVPLPLIGFGLWLIRPVRWLWLTQLAAALILWFPLWGFVLPFPSSAPLVTGAPKLRVLSFNVNSGYYGEHEIAQAITALAPDIVLLQEAPWDGGWAGSGPLRLELQAHFPYVASATQFTIASRFPITRTTPATGLPGADETRPPSFMRYVVDTPLGAIAAYSIHPVSPRGLFGIASFGALRQQVRTGKILAGDPEGDVLANASLREAQIAAAAAAAARETVPVIIAGDTNLPGLSAAFRRHLSNYRDGFRAASWGFGYTYSQRRPALRLDRILASENLRFVSFAVGCPGLSDHRCVVADIQALQ